MITRFRVEAKHSNKEFLMEQLQAAALRLIAVASETREATESNGEWECTDERIEGRPGNYKGRMVFVYDQV